MVGKCWRMFYVIRSRSLLQLLLLLFALSLSLSRAGPKRFSKIKKKLMARDTVYSLTEKLLKRIFITSYNACALSGRLSRPAKSCWSFGIGDPGRRADGGVWWRHCCGQLPRHFRRSPIAVGNCMKQCSFGASLARFPPWSVWQMLPPLRDCVQLLLASPSTANKDPS